MKNVNLANTLVITGEVVVSKLIDTAHYESTSEDFWAITIQHRSGTKHNFSVSNNVYSGFEYANLFFLGNLITAELQDCIADETEYLNEDGDVTTHDKTHLRFVSAVNTSKVVMDAEGISLSLIKEYLEARAHVSIASQQPKFYAKKSEDASPNRVIGLIDRWSKSSALIQDSIKNTLIALGYSYDPGTDRDDIVNFTSKPDGEGLCTRYYVDGSITRF